MIRDRIRELRRVPARDLLPNPKNWRRHPQAQANALRGLLEEIGFADALLARELPDGKLMLIDGHLRAESTPEFDVPVLILDLDEAEADKLLLTLDPLASLAESDAERISSLLQTVRTDNAAVEELLRRTAGERLWSVIHPQAEPPAQVDQAGELQRKWGTATGQLWRIGEHRLFCGDATNAEDVSLLMSGERAVLFATDPPYAVGYTGGSHPQSWGNKGAANRDKDWSGQYVEAKNADVKNTEEAGIDLYRGFIKMALEFAIVRNAAWYLWHASKRHSMVEQIWCEFGAFVHQQIIWVKSRPVLTYSTYLWQHEPCPMAGLKVRSPRRSGRKWARLRASFRRRCGRFRAPKSRPMRIRRRSRVDFSPFPWRCTPNAVKSATSRSPAAVLNWWRRSRPDGAASPSKNLPPSSPSHWNVWPHSASSLSW
jgi:hypothetical protein